MFDYTDKYGPQQVGGRYFCAYWRKEYTVTALDPDGFISIKWEDGTTGRHLTPWDHGRDRVIRQPIDPCVAALALDYVKSLKTPDTIMLFSGVETYATAIERAKDLLLTTNPTKKMLVARILSRRGL